MTDPAHARRAAVLAARTALGIALPAVGALAACTVERAAPRDTTVVTAEARSEPDTIRQAAGGEVALATDSLTALDTDAAPPPRALPDTASPMVTASDLELLGRRALVVPVAGVPAGELLDTFGERRGSRPHAALDIPAPRGTPVVAADAGRVAKLHTSAGGGLTVYVADSSGRFIYYYAHLDRYRDGLADGQTVARGETLGYVGTTGNAPPNVPHLHFAIVRTNDPSAWWRGTPIDPLPILQGRVAAD